LREQLVSVVGVFIMAQQAFPASIDILKIWVQANGANPATVSCRVYSDGREIILPSGLFRKKTNILGHECHA